MVKLQNNFLKLYEEMNHLWESGDASITDTSNTKYDFSFPTIAQKALKNAGEDPLSLEDTTYWCELRKILLNKHIRLGDVVAST